MCNWYEMYFSSKVISKLCLNVKRVAIFDITSDVVGVDTRGQVKRFRHFIVNFSASRIFFVFGFYYDLSQIPNNV